MSLGTKAGKYHFVVGNGFASQCLKKPSIEKSFIGIYSILGRPISRRELGLYTRKLPIRARVLKESPIIVRDTFFPIKYD